MNEEDQEQTNSQYEEDDYDSELTMGNNQQNTETSSNDQETSKGDDDFDDLPF